jgi:hypothetical protein
MKFFSLKVALLIAFSLSMTFTIDAQTTPVDAADNGTPLAFTYQGLARDAQSNRIARNQDIGIEASLLQDSPQGAAIYTEVHTVRTDNFGVFNTAIGAGLSTLGDFSDVDWSDGPYFLQISIDARNTGNYELLGVTQLLSVPYALYAERAGSSDGGDSGDSGLWEDRGSYILPADEDKSVWIGDVGGDATLRQKLVVSGAVYPVFNQGFLTPSEVDQVDNRGNAGRTGMFYNFGGDLFHRGFWGVVVDRNAGGFDQTSSSYFGGVNPDAGSFAVRYRTSSSAFRTDLIVRANGDVGIGTKNPASKLEVTDGDVYINDVNSGVIMKSPNGNCWRMTVDNSGQPVYTQISCPN